MATAITSSWVIGSFDLAATVAITVNGTNYNIAAGTYYLRDSNSDLSLIAQLQTAIATEVPGSTVVLCKDRKMRVISGGGNITLSMPVALRTETGFGASTGPGTTLTATNISNLLWSPGWPDTPIGHPVQTEGRTVYDRVVNSSPDGMVVSVNYHHVQTVGQWQWFQVPQTRSWTTAESPGEYKRFYDDVLIPGYRFKHYSGVEEDSSSTSTISLGTGFGPYIAHTLQSDWYQRWEPGSDSLGTNIELQGILTREIA